ncbi:MAG: flagellin lysine-N-methylase [Niameybacter sp.]|uniref:flagellin lysine-N-methylase n=1 Tax=Niameybacter sp. TaxID=2033640 RepID=UPI002FC92EB7
MSEQKQYKRVVPSYLKDFKCIGGKCEDTCCAGWCIEVDAGTYAKYKKVEHKTLKNRMNQDIVDRKQKATDAFAAEIQLKNNRCAFLSEGGLCDIYSGLGEDHLSHTCGLYPRTLNRIHNTIEYSMTFSCPEAARQILLQKAPMTFSESEQLVYEGIISADVDLNVEKPREWQDYFFMIRDKAISLLQNRAYGLEERLTHVEGLMLGVTELAQKGKVKEVPSFIEKYTGEKFKGEREVDAGILIERLYFLQQDMELPSERYEACLHQMLEGLGLTGETTLQQAYKLYIKGERGCFKDFLEQKGHILENYLVNYIYERCIPLDGATPIESYEWMLLYYTLIKVHVIGMGMATQTGKKVIQEEQAIQLIQSFTKTYDHNDGYLSYFVD